ncbi:PREDICTED: uncharacterized protein LOC108613734 [Drosophila arizonae]|uniref:Uncharacterized protein LOC108613734 n=1 Tax=Drosophila arizonae TaxID=7263 RepID=A0ABM1P6N4_DROAR|nr:PREDICTED: uncharacterized protein LOC108613734 [Drosophila arizonae]
MNGKARKDSASSSAHREKLLRIKNVLYWCRQLNMLPEEVQKLSQQQKSCRRLLIKQAEEMEERRKEQFKRWQNISELRWLMYEEQRKYNEKCGQQAADISIWQILSMAQHELEQELNISKLLGSCPRFPSPMSIMNTYRASGGTNNVLEPVASVIMGLGCNSSLNTSQSNVGRLSGENMTPIVSRQLSGDGRTPVTSQSLPREEPTSLESGQLSEEELSPSESSQWSSEEVTPHASRERLTPPEGRQLSGKDSRRPSLKHLTAGILTRIESELFSDKKPSRVTSHQLSREELRRLASGQLTPVTDQQLLSQPSGADSSGQNTLVNEHPSATSAIQLSRTSKPLDSSESDDEQTSRLLTTDEFVGIRRELREIQRSTRRCDEMIDMLFAEYLAPITQAKTSAE